MNIQRGAQNCDALGAGFSSWTGITRSGQAIDCSAQNMRDRNLRSFRCKLKLPSVALIDSVSIVETCATSAYNSRSAYYMQVPWANGGLLTTAAYFIGDSQTIVVNWNTPQQLCTNTRLNDAKTYLQVRRRPRLLNETFRSSKSGRCIIGLGKPFSRERETDYSSDRTVSRLLAISRRRIREELLVTTFPNRQQEEPHRSTPSYSAR